MSLRKIEEQWLISNRRCIAETVLSGVVQHNVEPKPRLHKTPGTLESEEKVASGRKCRSSELISHTPIVCLK